jgi:hypothetical protein
MKHNENEKQQDPEPTSMALKLFLYTVAGAVAYGLMALVATR